MLVISRREGESVMIGGEIVVTVVRIEGRVVRLGIKAPKHIRILRDDAKKVTQ